MSQISVYDDVPYPTYPQPPSHPDRLATIAALLGLRGAAVDRCRVLELGCGNGGNLIPMAETLGGSQFLGIDASGQQIAAGQEVIRQLGLTNIRLQPADLVELDAALGTFDYVICHGVYSWTAEPARAKILALCGELLAPSGVAYVNYNTYPGWHVQGIVRDVLQQRAGKLADPAERIQRARETIAELLAVFAADDSPYASALKTALEAADRFPDAYLFHSLLNVVNSPSYLHEFVGEACGQGLQYLGDAQFSAMWISALPPRTRNALHELADDAIELEQYVDFLRNTMSRRTLLCRREIELDRSLEARCLNELHVSAAIDPGRSQLAAPQATFTTYGGQTIRTSHPQLNEALQQLAQAWPASLPFDDLWQQIEARAAAGAALPEAWHHALLRCFAAGVVELSVRPSSSPRVIPELPRATRLARHQAAAGEVVTNLRHQTVRLSASDRQLLCLLDGDHDRQALPGALHRAADDAMIDAGLQRLNTRALILA